MDIGATWRCSCSVYIHWYSEVASADSYIDAMQDAGLSIGFEQQEKAILEQSNTLAKNVSGSLVLLSGLLDDVVNLVEAPHPVLGKFGESFLELSKDLLIMVMQKHQKYFATTDSDGKLLPYFIAVANGAINEDVRTGNEAVLRARYEDAKFFYGLDTSKRFSEFRSQQRNRFPFVTEFTSLAGVMGRQCALRDGYSEQIAEALFEITLPQFSGDILPKTDAGVVLAIADRLDSLIELFAADCQRSSTVDPFGLRRISYCLVQLLVETNQNLELRHALELAAAVQPIEVESQTIDDVQQFVLRRLEQLLIDQRLTWSRSGSFCSC